MSGNLKIQTAYQSNPSAIAPTKEFLFKNTIAPDL